MVLRHQHSVRSRSRFDFLPPRQEFVTALQKRNAQQLKLLVSRFGCFDAKRNSKQQNAEHVCKARKMDAAGAHLAVLADTLEQDAAETLEADPAKLKNTVRRSEMAAGVRGRAYANQAMAGTLKRFVVALESGEANYLDGVWAGTHVTALIRLLGSGKTKRNQQLLAEKGELGVWDRHRATEELDNRPLAREDAAFAEYPFPSVSRHHFKELLASAANTKGLKQVTRRLQSYAIGDREQYFIEFVDQSDIALLIDYLARCRSEEHTSELQSRRNLVCRLLLEKKKKDSTHVTP